jgi:perosamine synthetase
VLTDEQNLQKKSAVKQSVIPLSVPSLQGNEWRYLKECLDSNWVSSAGPFVDRFETMVAQYVHRDYGVACVNGTAALHTALQIVGVKPTEEVVMPVLTFVAPANAVSYIGAHPLFIDVDPVYWQIDVQKLKDFFLQECIYKEGRLVNKHTQRKIAAILPVHLLGHPVDMRPLLALARQYDLKVVEDVAEGLGTEYEAKRVGSFGDVAALSFNGNKIITTGGGGMMVTNRPDWAEKARYLTTQAKSDPLENIHDDIGYNYRLTNIQAALGVAQMEQLPHYIEKKRNIAKGYARALKEVAGISLPQEAPWGKSTFWLYTILVDSAKYGMDSRRLLGIFKEADIQTRPLWHPLYRLKPFKECFAYKISVADHLYEQAISLPSSVGLTEQEQARVIRVIKAD